MLYVILMFVSLFGNAVASDLDQNATYWFAEDDSTGFIPQGVKIDLPNSVNGQVAAIVTVVMNACKLMPDGTLVSQTGRLAYSFSVGYTPSEAKNNIQAELPGLGSLQKTASFLLVQQTHQLRATFDPPLPDTLYLKRTVVDSAGVNVTTTEHTFSP